MVPFVVGLCHRNIPAGELAARGQGAEDVGNAAVLVVPAEDQVLAVQGVPGDLRGHRVFRHEQAAVAGRGAGSGRGREIAVGAWVQGIGVDGSHIGEGRPSQAGVGQPVVCGAGKALPRQVEIVGMAGGQAAVLLGYAALGVRRCRQQREGHGRQQQAEN